MVARSSRPALDCESVARKQTGTVWLRNRSSRPAWAARARPIQYLLGGKREYRRK